MSSPDYRGERFIKQNPLNSQATLVQKYDEMLQLLHLRTGNGGDARLSEHLLAAKRLSLKREARDVVSLVVREKTEVQKWSDLESADQLYYDLVFEEKAAAIGISIYHCKKQWCARNMLQEVLKAKNQTKKRRAERGEVEEPSRKKQKVGLLGKG